jgi:hypothetical protein
MSLLHSVNESLHEQRPAKGIIRLFSFSFFFLFFLYVCIYLVNFRCERICCLANLKACSAGHFACSVCIKEAALSAKKSGYMICYLLLFIFLSLSYIPCLLGQSSCTNMIGSFFVILFLYYEKC